MTQPVENDPPSPSRRLALAEVALIFLVFFVHAAWAAPEVNEPHYLGKAKHYWNPAWCAGDFFLESADAHHLFYWSFGWLTLLLPLPAVAWIGRLLTWGLLAWAWRRVSWALVPVPLMAALSAALFIALQSRFELAGEWVVGGVEAKGFAYVLVLLGLESLLRGRWNRVWLLLGGASALHVLVGGWSVLAAGAAWLADKERTPLVRMAPALAGGLLLALLGLVPALRLTADVPAGVVDEANQIYVFERLPHHLALHALTEAEFTRRVQRNAVLLAALLALAWLAPVSPAGRRLRCFVLATIFMAVAGLALSFALEFDRTLAARVLRYYWYRLYDVALPAGAALLAVQWLASRQAHRPRLVTAGLAIALGFGGYHLANVSYQRYLDPRPPADRKLRSADHVIVYAAPDLRIKRHSDQRGADSGQQEPDVRERIPLRPSEQRAADAAAVADWQDVCRWIADNTPPDARFLTPRTASTFRWYANRAEVVSHKDIPQEARAIVEWQRRLDDVHCNRAGEEPRYVSSLAQHGEPLLLELGEKYQARYLVERANRLLRLKQLYRQGSYVVYELTPTALDER